MTTVVGKKVGPIGFGLMGMTWRASPPPEEQSFRAMREALAHGSNFWNGGEIYGPPERNSLHMLNRYFTQYPEDAEKVVISIKGGINLETFQPDGSEEGIRRSVDNCLRLLDGKKKLDIFECARVDKSVPIETTIAALAKLVQEGKIGGIALSEVSAETVRRAAKVHPIACVEVEVSLFEDNAFQNGVADACAELNIPVLAYSPLGRGFLTGQFKSLDDLPQDDMRRNFPRFSPENFPKNLDLVHKVEAIAKKKGCTTSQVAIAWVREQSNQEGRPLFIPIPGATTPERVKENTVDVHLTSAETKELGEVLASFSTAGARYPEMMSGMLNG